MRRITRITNLRDFGIFRDFEWPDELADFARYNLIYGLNGTGKTTLSRLFGDIEHRRVPSQGRASVRIGHQEIQGTDFPRLVAQVRVFDKHFVNENVFPSGGGDLPPIFFLGAENVQRQRRFEQMEHERKELAVQLDLARQAATDVGDVLDRFCIDRARLVKERLRSPGKHRYNAYNKTRFQSDAKSMLTNKGNSSSRLSRSQRDSMLTLIGGTRKDRIPELDYPYPDLKSIAKEARELLKESVASGVILELKSDPELANWTRQGLRLHRDRTDARCQFCHQPLLQSRLEALSAHFNNQYEHLLKRIEAAIEDLTSTSEALASVRLPARAELYEVFGSEFEAAANQLKHDSLLIQKFLELTAKTLDDKRCRIFETVESENKIPAVDVDVDTRLNQIIRRHNRMCDDFENQVEDARIRLAEDMVAGELPDFLELAYAAEQARSMATSKQQELDELQLRMNALEDEIREHRRPAEELNREFAHYLGHPQIRLETKDNGYRIVRDGETAELLSEGETTAIASLYFLKSLQDKDFDLANGVVVLDDPISSLDVNALFLAVSFINERTRDAGQLFVLTHNLTLFREVRRWFRSDGDVQKDHRLLMLASTYRNNSRSSDLRNIDPMLGKFDSEHHFLFAIVFEASKQPSPQDLTQNYTLPNLARRLLEGVLAFKMPDDSLSLWMKMQRIDFDNVKKNRIYRYVNAFSHASTSREPINDLNPFAEVQAVLNDLLDLIETLDPEHYNTMVKLVEESAKNG